MKYSFHDVLEQTTDESATMEVSTIEKAVHMPIRAELQKSPILEQILGTSKPKQKSKLLVEGEKYFLLSEDGVKRELNEDQVQTIHNKLRAKFEEEEKIRLLQNLKVMYHERKQNHIDWKEAIAREKEEKAKQEKARRVCPICYDPDCSFW